jgi:hypothetical protein
MSNIEQTGVSFGFILAVFLKELYLGKGFALEILS